MYQLQDSQTDSLPPRPRALLGGFVAVLALSLLGTAGVLVAGIYLPQTAAQSYWFISRSSGVVAYLLITLGVLLGLMQSGSLLRKQLAPLVTLGLHSFFSWLGLGMAALHGFILIGDSYTNFDWVRVLTPFLATYRPLPVGLGIVSFYLMLLLSLSFYARLHLGQRAFRTLHYASFGAFAMVTAHGIYAGSDSGALWWLYALSVAAVLGLTAVRVVVVRRKPTARVGGMLPAGARPPQAH